MRWRVVSTFLASMLLFSAMLGILFVRPVESEPGTWTVDDDRPADFTSIQRAIDAVSPRDTILVMSGKYRENVVVNKSVTLIGENHNTIIDGKGAGTVVYITASNVTLSGFTVQNSGPGYLDSGIRVANSSGNNISHNVIKTNSLGIRLEGSDNNTFSDNLMVGNAFWGIWVHGSAGNFFSGNGASHNKIGIYLVGSGNNTFSGNTVVSNTFNGVYFDDSTDNFFSINGISNNGVGIYLVGSGNNTFSGNTVVSNTFEGIYIDDSAGNFLSGNSISNNDVGIYLHGSSNNTVSDNTALNNKYYGIYLHDSSSNTLTGNDASNNKYNFGVFGHNFSHFNNYVDTSNTVDGKPIYYLIGVANATCDNQIDAGTIYLINCTKITIKDLTLTRNGNGIFLWNTTSSRIWNVTASSNIYGIQLDDSSGNTIFNNNFINNVEHVVSHNSNNTWNDNYPHGGNYWGDYAGADLDVNGIGDTPHPIDENNHDNYPLMGSFSLFDAKFGNVSYVIQIVCNSTIADFRWYREPYGKNNVIHFKVDDTEDKGFCRICIPHALIEPPYRVTVDYNSPLYNEIVTTNGTHTWLYFMYDPLEHEVMIVHAPGQQLVFWSEWWFWAIIALMAVVVVSFSYNIKQKKAIQAYERNLATVLQVIHRNSARALFKADVEKRGPKIRDFQKKYHIRLRNAKTLEDALEKMGVKREKVKR